MKFYFSLQFLRLKRHIDEAGANSIFVLLILPLLFVFGANQLFIRLDYAEYIFCAFALVFVNMNGNAKRNDFLKNSFRLLNYKKIRVIENSLFVTPFVLFLLYQHQFLFSLILIFLSIILSFFNKVNAFNFAIPTPFYRYPFEFIVGFRNTFYVFIMSYTLTIIAVSVDNFNLGIFGLIVSFLTCMSYYSMVEPIFYVWNYSCNPKIFLLKKIEIILLYCLLISLPILILLIVFYPENWWIILIFEVLGLLIVIINMLGKYAYFPSEINIIQALAIIFCVLLPPLMLVVIPYFFTKSSNNLKRLLK